MKKIKVVYEWVGPDGPLANNSIPTLYEFAAKTHSGRNMNSRFSGGAYLFDTLFQFFPDVFELAPSFTIKDDDVFIYDFQVHYRVPFHNLFSYGADFGMLESIEMSPSILHNIKNGNGYFLIDCASESFVSNHIFYHMHNYFKSHEIPLNKIIYQTGCPNVDEIYNKFCDTVGLTQENRMNVLFWDSFEYQLSQRHVGDGYESNRTIETIDKTFLSLNYRYRPHRIDLLLLFYKHGLLNDSYFSMPENDPNQFDHKFIQYVDRNFSKRIGLSAEDLNVIQNEILPLTVDEQASSYGNHLSMTLDINRDLVSLYESSMISVVTETLAYEEAIAETEKSFKPIIYKQPFIIVGQAKSLQNLKNKGYKTFSKWFDESYDDITDNKERIIKIVELCKTISDWDRDTKEKFINETKEITEHNYRNFTNIYQNILPNFWRELQNKHN